MFMKRVLAFFFVAFATLSCSKTSPLINENDPSLDFYENGVHITIKKGNPMGTKTTQYEEALTIIGEKDDISFTIYTLGTYEEDDFSKYDAFTESGVKIGTFVYCNNILVNFELSAELDTLSEEEEIGTKAREKDESYGDCVKRSATNMNHRLDEDPINAAICDFLPCHAVTLVVAVVECARK